MITAALASLLLAAGASAYDASRTDNTVAYYGQNSYGAGHSSDTANFQQKLAFYCEDDSVDVFPLSFLHVFFSDGGLPSINMANTCNTNDNKVFPGSQLPDCSFLAEDIKKCQAKGKLVTMSLGGATGGAVFTGDDQATKFADQIWDLLLGGKSDTRPFGDAVLDGIDLDIEGGSPAGYTAFAKQLRSHFDGAADKKYILTGAPQCVFPDAYLGDTISQVAFDALYVQFYNNFCGVANFDNVNAWNYQQWDDWAKTKSPNKDVKIFIGVPASQSAANAGSFVDVARVADIAKQTRDKYSSFGGIMYWDASQAYMNNRFDKAIKDAIRSGDAPAPVPSGTAAPSSPASAPVPSDTAVPSCPASAPVPSGTAAPSGPVSEPIPSGTAVPSGPVSDPIPSGTAVPSGPVSEPIPSGTAAPSGPASAPAPSGTATPPAGDCSSAKAWDAATVYTGGMTATDGGKLWTASWWTQNEKPGGASGVWKDSGACAGAKHAAPRSFAHKKPTMGSPLQPQAKVLKRGVFAKDA